jgi:hypothetical protein
MCQTVRWRTKTCHDRFHLGRDFGLVDEDQRAVIEKELATEPIPTSAELDLIRPETLGIERQAHIKSVTLRRYSIATADLVGAAGVVLPILRIRLLTETAPATQAKRS